MNTKTTLSLAALLLAAVSLFIWAPWQGDLPQTAQEELAAGSYRAEDSPSPAPIVWEEQADALQREELLATAASELAEGFLVEVRDAVTLQTVPGATVYLMSNARMNEPEVRRIQRAENLGTFARTKRFGSAYTADAQGRARLPESKGLGSLTLVAEGASGFGYRWSMDGNDVDRGVEILLHPEQRIEVQVQGPGGVPAADVAVGFEPSPLAWTSAPHLTVRTDAAGLAVFRHIELLTQDHPERPVTVALLVPCAAPQAVEISPAAIGKERILLQLPATGSLEVAGFEADGTPMDDGTPLVLQLADDRARAAAGGEEQRGNPRGFSMKTSLGLQIGYIRSGVAIFPQVGIGTELAIASYDGEAGGHAVQLITGPQQPGENLHEELHLSGAAAKATIRLLEGKDGSPLRNQTMGLVVSSVGQDGTVKGSGVEVGLDSDGIGHLPLSTDQVQAVGLWIASYPYRQEVESTLRIGYRELTVKELANTPRNWDIPFATEVLLEAQVIDEQGQPYVNQLLTWSIGLENAVPERKMVGDRWDLRTDGEGKIRILGPATIDGLGFLLWMPSTAGMSNLPGIKIPFQTGGQAQILVVPRARNLVGRVLVADSSFLTLIEADWITGPPGAVGSHRGSLLLEQPNGRFQLPESIASQGLLTLRLQAKGSGEELAILPGLLAQAELDGNSLRVPDWDLRDSLQKHHLVVMDQAGHPIPEVRIRTVGARGFRTLGEDGLLLSSSSVTPLLVGAEGFLEQEVFLHGETEVLLQASPTWHLDLQEALPQADGIHWMLHLMPTDANGAISLGGEGLLSTQLSPSGASVRLPHFGKWVLGIQAVRVGEDPAPFRGAYLFDGKTPFYSMDLGDGGQLDWSLELDADGLQAAIQEALEPPAED